MEDSEKKVQRPVNPLYLLDLDCTTEETSPAGGDETDFLSRHGLAVDGGSLSDMLVVSSSVRVIDGVHSHTTSTGPVVALGLVLVERTTSLKQWLVDTSTTGDDTDGRTAATSHGLLRTGWEADAGLALVGGVADDGSVVAGCPSERTAVADLLLNVANDGTLRALRDGEDVADGENGLLAAVDKGTGVETLGRDKCLLAELVAVGVTEDDTGEGSTTASIVDDLLHNTPDVTVALREVERTELGRRLVVVGVRLEDGMRTPLCPDNPTHCCV
jgi:hypothetical protein